MKTVKVVGLDGVPIPGHFRTDTGLVVVDDDHARYTHDIKMAKAIQQQELHSKVNKLDDRLTKIESMLQALINKV